MGTSTNKWIKIITLLLIMLLCIWDANDRFSRRDTDSGMFFSFAAITFAISAIFFFFHKRTFKPKERTKEEEIIISDKTILSMFITIIILCFTIFQLFTRINDFFDKKAEREQDRKDKIENYQRWIKEMTYNIDNLSKFHYLKTTYLKEKSSFQNFLKVIEIDDSEVKLVKFRVGAYNPIPRLIQESYIKDNKKDTITLTIEKLKNTIFSNSKIRENTYTYQDSLRKEGLFYLIEDMYYINGPSLSRQYEMATSKYGEGDTIFFNFENLNKKAHLTKIVNIAGDFEWHSVLPIPIKGFKLNSNRNVEFELKATNVDFKKDYKFKLYFEDSLKNKHIFLVTKRFQDQPYFYESKRVFD
ncbi:hypothetical protein [Tenacibaculum sp. SDUM215027]|uniref:hypothetical protein n=1 Tax=Tenacibaculum sp. SDUM215027 TaxID=3422596 RepID=UPI003D321EF1